MILTHEECMRKYTGDVIGEGAVIGALRKHVTDCIVIHGIGETKTCTALHCDDGLIITIGCINSHRGDTIDNVEAAIRKKYVETNHPYYAVLDLIKSWDNYCYTLN